MRCTCSGQPAENPKITETLAEFKDSPGLSLQWVLFGSSGRDDRPEPGGPLAHYTQCTGVLSYQMKCVANMFWAAPSIMAGDTVHDCSYRYAPSPLLHLFCSVSGVTVLQMYSRLLGLKLAFAGL